jgi:hypothetical protein
MQKLHLICLALLLFLLFSISAEADWTQPLRISEGGSCHFPKIVIDRNIVHVAYQMATSYNKIDYLRSTDNGITWQNPIQLSERPGQMMFAMLLVNENNIIVFWDQIYNSGINRYNIGYAKSTDSGSTWSAPQYLFSENWPNIQYFVASGDSNNIAIIIGAQVGNDFTFYTLGSSDFGVNWSTPHSIVSCYASGFPDCAVFDSTVYIVWDGKYDNQHTREIHSTYSLDLGLNWVNDTVLSSDDEFHSQFPAISLNDYGIPYVTWMDYKNSPYIDTGDIFFRKYSLQDSIWEPEIQITDDHEATISDLSVSNDTVRILWLDHRPDNGRRSIYYSESINDGMSWEEAVRLDITTDDSWDPAIAAYNSKVYTIWAEDRISPDTGGLYFSMRNPENDNIENDNSPGINYDYILEAYPNPFNSATAITITGLEQADIGIYDITGRLITTLHSVGGQALWDASTYSSGLYFARATGEKVETIKLILLK